MIRVVATTEQGAGIGYDLTDQIEGLTWSSINPGGDESCSFILKRSWFADSPEIERGNLLQVLDGVDVLWRGRVEEADRGGDSTETIGVTAYGLGARLKDSTLREIYVDPDLSKWGSIPNERIEALGTIWVTDMGNAEVRPGDDGASVLSHIYTRLANTESQKGVIESWYDASGIEIAQVLFANTKFINVASGNPWTALVFGAADRIAGGISIGANRAGILGQGELVMNAGTIYASVQLYYNAAFVGDGEWRADWQLVVIGRHGLPLQGEGLEVGFTVGQLVEDAASRADGITIRRIDETAFLVRQSVYSTPTKLEDAIIDMNRFEVDRRTFGTWGPDSPLDNTLDGYFDYRAIDDEATWIVRREECDSCDLTSETATLFDKIEVTYTDNSGIPRTVTVTAEVPDLNGMHRTEAIDIGKETRAGAEAFGIAFLALSGSFAPARGSAAISRPVLHVDRGPLPAHYMRADGSAFQVQGILPASSVFALDQTPNRRTTFPIKRVSVDASSKANPVASVEVDQSADAIAALQARLAQNAELPPSAAAITR
jgi:hypothetical protein